MSNILTQYLMRTIFLTTALVLLVVQEPAAVHARTGVREVAAADDESPR